jgi:hypothetical protein
LRRFIEVAVNTRELVAAGRMGAGGGLPSSTSQLELGRSRFPSPTSQLNLNRSCFPSHFSVQPEPFLFSLSQFSAQPEPFLTLKSTETTRRVLQKVLKSSRIVDECKTLGIGCLDAAFAFPGSSTTLKFHLVGFSMWHCIPGLSFRG